MILIIAILIILQIIIYLIGYKKGQQDCYEYLMQKLKEEMSKKQ